MKNENKAVAEEVTEEVVVTETAAVEVVEVKKKGLFGKAVGLVVDNRKLIFEGIVGVALFTAGAVAGAKYNESRHISDENGDEEFRPDESLFNWQAASSEDETK